MAENRNLAPTWATTAGLGFLTLNSGLAIYRAKGDPASIFFVLGSYLTLLLLFGYLRAYERAPHVSPARERARRAVWPLTTLLTAAFSSPRAGAAGAGHPMERQVAALMMAAFGAMACDSALAVHDARGGDVVSAAAVLVAYAALLALTFRFLRAFAGRARGVGHGQDDEGRGVTAVDAVRLD
ncbi:uncharacterized protein [Setaria viridis]|uniref:Uncharacterized protein n=1 Tax=Setaria viridis TaxID=4556 RepID=A0A4U6UVY0_SETVI|nr:uncharacterized protein LOC117854100 [Setaria viridis]TKW19635.1 hypothetical protein SEVIR_4G033500v2 [Setaria viridis]